MVFAVGKAGLPFGQAAWVRWEGKPTGVIVEQVQVASKVNRLKLFIKISFFTFGFSAVILWREKIILNSLLR